MSLPGAVFGLAVSPPGAAIGNGTFNSLNLSWVPTHSNSNGTIVYLLQMKYKGDQQNPWRDLKTVGLHFVLQLFSFSKFPRCMHVIRFISTSS
mgnify:CR=1 FL=1